MRHHALISVVGMLLTACAVGTEPPLQLGLSSGGQAGDASAGSGGLTGDAASVAGGGSGASAGSSPAGAAGLESGGDAGSAGSVGSGGNAGMGGNAGAGGNAGTGGNVGAGGMPAVAKPAGIMVSATKNATQKQAPSSGGSAYSDDCPANQVLIGFRGTIDGGIASLRSVSGVCATLKVAADAPYAISTTQVGMLPARETAGSTIENAMCPANQVVVGFSGRTATYIEALVFRCAPLTVSGSAPSYQLDIGSAGDTPAIGGENAGSSFNAINCGAGQVAVSQVPNAGSAIDNFGLKCAALGLVVN